MNIYSIYVNLQFPFFIGDSTKKKLKKIDKNQKHFEIKNDINKYRLT